MVKAQEEGGSDGQRCPNDDQLQHVELVKESAAYEAKPGDIPRARDLARAFLERLQSVHGLPVSERAMGMVQLVVSELLTNACT